MACGTADEPAENAEPITPSDITCPSGQVGGSPGGEYPPDNLPEGSPTPEQAAEEWVGGAYPGAEYIVVQQGVWVMRDDGTASARGEFLDGIEGYFVSGYRACID